MSREQVAAQWVEAVVTGDIAKASELSVRPLSAEEVEVERRLLTGLTQPTGVVSVEVRAFDDRDVIVEKIELRRTTLTLRGNGDYALWINPATWSRKAVVWGRTGGWGGAENVLF